MSDDDEWRYVPVPNGASIQKSFEQFHRANPWVYGALVDVGRDLVRRGQSNLGIGMLAEVVRWRYFRRTSDPSSDFKLNNNYRSRYVRLIEANEDDLAGRFKMRSLRAP